MVPPHCTPAKEITNWLHLLCLLRNLVSVFSCSRTILTIETMCYIGCGIYANKWLWKLNIISSYLLAKKHVTFWLLVVELYWSAHTLACELTFLQKQLKESVNLFEQLCQHCSEKNKLECHSSVPITIKALMMAGKVIRGGTGLQLEYNEGRRTDIPS